MITRLLTTVAALVLLLAAPAVAQSSKGPDVERRRAALERWEGMPPEKRALLRERFEAYRGMDEAQRRELRRRFEQLRDVERDVEAELPEDVRERLEGLPPAERRELLREHLSDELHERGRRRRRALPRELFERLKSADPGSRRGMLRERFGRVDLDGALRDLGRKLELGPSELERLTGLPERDKRDALLGLRRRELSARVAREGLPPWLDEQRWRSWQALSDRAFFEALHGAREANDPQAERRRELRRLLRPDPATLAELAHLPERGRRSELERRMRAGALDKLEASPGLLPEGELEVLRGLEGRAFFERLREHMGGAEHDGPRRGADRHRGRRSEVGPEGPRRAPPGAGGERGPDRRGPPQDGARQGKEPSRGDAPRGESPLG